MFQFEKPGAYMQALKSGDNSTVSLQNRGSRAIDPKFYFVPFVVYVMK
jgi:hypothetical protein